MPMMRLTTKYESRTVKGGEVLVRGERREDMREG